MKRHVANIYGKLDVTRRWDAVAQAKALGLLVPAGGYEDPGPKSQEIQLYTFLPAIYTSWR